MVNFAQYLQTILYLKELPVSEANGEVTDWEAQ